MKTYIGTKIIHAKPMTRGAYNALRGWEVPPDENPADDGFLVEYLDGGKANVNGFSGYVSWSPAEVFERAYRPTTAMTFGDAIAYMWAGSRVARAGWNGKNMNLLLCGSSSFPLSDDELCDTPYIVMQTATGNLVPWLASQTDMLAEDWTLVD